MDIKALLPRPHVLLHLVTAPRRDLLRQLAAPLVAEGLVTDAERFLDDLERREDQITTQIRKDVALPHTRSDGVRRLAFGVGVADGDGLLYDPASGPHCRVLFLIAVPAMAPTAHLPLLQHLVHFATDHRRLLKLAAATTPAQVVSLLAAYKGPK
ncbi:MAG: PTS sugar transporter subunit IIA [bacterium]